MYPESSGEVVNMGLLDKMRGGSSAKVTDPVCGMTIDQTKAAVTSQHGAQTYHFCSAGCKQKFDADPHKFLGAHSH